LVAGTIAGTIDLYGSSIKFDARHGSVNVQSKPYIKLVTSVVRSPAYLANGLVFSVIHH
jgi:hypothetical protein